MHKYAMALWLVDEDIRSVQAVVRQGPLFFEAPTVALWEYARQDLLGMMEVSYAPDMYIRSQQYGADEFFEIQGTRGFVWVTRLCGNLHVTSRRSCSTRKTGGGTSFASSTRPTTIRSAGPPAHFVDALLTGTRSGVGAGRPRSRRSSSRSPSTRRRTARAPVDPASIDGAVSPNGWPPDRAKLKQDVEAMVAREAARAERLDSTGGS